MLISNLPWTTKSLQWHETTCHHCHRSTRYAIIILLGHFSFNILFNHYHCLKKKITHIKEERKRACPSCKIWKLTWAYIFNLKKKIQDLKRKDFIYYYYYLLFKARSVVGQCVEGRDKWEWLENKAGQSLPLSHITSECLVIGKNGGKKKRLRDYKFYG